MKIWTGLAVAFLAFALLVTPLAAMPQPPNAFYGAVTIGGAPAPNGTNISAKIGGVEYATSTTSGGRYGEAAWFNVPSDDPDTTQKEGGVSGDVVAFYVDGNKANEEATFQWGARMLLNLTVSGSTTPPPTGGGGFPPLQPTPTPTVKTDLLGKTATFPISDRGEFLEAVHATSEDTTLALTIDKATIGLDKDGKALTGVSVTHAVSPPAMPKNSLVVGLAYDFGPGGATFNPPMTLEYNYDPADVPPGTNEKDLTLAYYDVKTAKWVTVESVVDTAAHKITARVAHFTMFAVMGRTPPAFLVSDMLVQPAQVKPGDPVTITASVTNAGGTEGNYNLVLEVNSTKEAERAILVAPGATTSVTFTVTRPTAGTYKVVLGSLSGSFVVTPAPTTPPPTTPTPAPPTSAAPPPTTPPPTGTIRPSPSSVPSPGATTQVPTATPAPSPSLSPVPTSSPAPAVTPSGTNWGIIGGAAGGVIIIALLIVLLVRRGRSRGT